MTNIRKLTFAGMFCALLIGCQFVLSAIAGVELVTVLLLSYCAFFGPWQGMATATAFSFLRCLVFGFTPTSLILYLVYFNLFALFFGLVAGGVKHHPQVKRYIILTFLAVLSTALFTFLDDAITPLFYGYTAKQAYAYFVLSFTTMIPHCICTLITVPCLLPPLMKLYAHLPLEKQ